MPSTSKSQQRLMGMVHAYQKGELKTQGMDKDLLSKVKSMAKQMKPKSVEDFAKTKHENLPQKVEKKTINFKYFSLLEYVDGEMDMRKFLDTIDEETDVDILIYLLELIYSKKKYQDEIEKYFSDDENMLKFPLELAKEDDDETISYIDKFITKRINNIKDSPSDKKPKKKKKKEKEYPKINKLGFGVDIEEDPETLLKQDVKTAYKRTSKDTGFGFKFRHMESFSTFLNEAKKKKDPKKEMAKHRSKIMREERLKSGAKLGTKVVPDKKKQYKRKKNVDLDDE